MGERPAPPSRTGLMLVCGWPWPLPGDADRWYDRGMMRSPEAQMIGVIEP